MDIQNKFKPNSDLKLMEQVREVMRFHRLAGKLPAIHKAPFDRMLISQAIIEKLTLITRDKQIAQYDVNCLNA